ncbi:MAG: hypothetical protein JXB10_00495 [Pirellulales bacterium]|nr:hypothetical protein [Pirellulales bacterium]
MPTFHLHRLLEFFSGLSLLMSLLWLGLALLTVGMLILLRTRWGQSRPLQKCLGLSLLAHLLFGVYATTVQIVGSLPPLNESYVDVAFLDVGEGSLTLPDRPVPDAKVEKPWEQFPADRVTQPDLQQPKPEPVEPLREPQRRVRTPSDKLSGATPLSPADPARTKLPEPKLAEIHPAIGARQPEEEAQPIEAPMAERREAPDPLMPTAAAPKPPSLPDTPPVILKSPRDGVPSALLQPVAPLQRLDAPVTPDPAEALPGETEPNSRRVHAHPAETLTPPHESSAGRILEGAAEQTRRENLPDHPAGSPGQALQNASAVPQNNSIEAAPLPDAYKLRTIPNRFGIARQHGATAETEKAVQAALKWLAENQAPDGRWDAGDHEAGVELQVLGRDRQNAGSQADSAVTGLALLAFLAAGNTHQSGDYQDHVRRGLEYLLSLQAADGNLGDKATIYEMMYAHAMAACALSEAYGMTKDPRLREPVLRAVNYIVKTQDPKGGGWRYLPNIPGDTSQLGWAVMTLKSAELAGIVMPEATRQGIIRFLQSVSAGKSGGLASYRPGEQVSRAMSAEALVCWQFLGLPRQHPACNEAGNYLLGQLPGQDVKPNDYYWYYATLGMFQLQGEYWQRWNQSMREVIVDRQVQAGPQTGSWNTDTLWGGYGGRVYTTAIATLTLEVYYRYLPLYAETAVTDRQLR